jgi:hypothetical protein
MFFLILIYLYQTFVNKIRYSNRKSILTYRKRRNIFIVLLIKAIEINKKTSVQKNCIKNKKINSIEPFAHLIRKMLFLKYHRDEIGRFC